MLNMTKDEVIKKEILKAAASVFQKWGYNKTTMEDIAKEAGKGKSTLYYYYKNKEEIFTEVVLSDIAQMSSVAESAISKVDSAEKKLKVYVHTIFVELKKYTNLYTIVRGEAQGNHEIVNLIRFKYDANEEKLIQKLLKEGIERKEFVHIFEKDIISVSHAIMTIIRGIAIELFVQKDNNEEQIDTVIGLFLTGL